MFLPEVTIAMLWQTEYGWTLLHWAWKRPSVHCPVLPHGLDQVEDSFAVWTGAFLNTGGRLVGLQMLQQGLLGVVTFPTGCTVVEIVWCISMVALLTRCFPHLGHTCTDFPSCICRCLLRALAEGKSFLQNVQWTSSLTGFGTAKGTSPALEEPAEKDVGNLPLRTSLAPLLMPHNTAFLMTTSSGPNLTKPAGGSPEGPDVLVEGAWLSAGGDAAMP